MSTSASCPRTRCGSIPRCGHNWRASLSVAKRFGPTGVFDGFAGGGVQHGHTTRVGIVQVAAPLVHVSAQVENTLVGGPGREAANLGCAPVVEWSDGLVELCFRQSAVITVPTSSPLRARVRVPG